MNIGGVVYLIRLKAFALFHEFRHTDVVSFPPQNQDIQRRVPLFQIIEFFCHRTTVSQIFIDQLSVNYLKRLDCL